MKKKILLASNSSHYVYTAEKYLSNDMLGMYCASFLIDERKISLFPGFYKYYLSSRAISPILSLKVKNILWPEVLLKILNKVDFIPVSRRFLLQNKFFSILTSRQILKIKPDIFHFVSGLGYESLIRNKNLKFVAICDQRATYYKHEQEISNEEQVLNNLGWSHPELDFFERLEEEYRISDYIIVNSHYAKKSFVRHGFNEEKIVVIHLGVDIDIFYPLNIQKHKKFHVVFVGNIHPRKGLQYLLKACEFLYDKVELLLIGNIVDKSVITEGKNVKILGHMPKNKLNEVLNKCHVMVLPSIDDSFGLVGLEALAAGLPLISSSNCGVSELIEDSVDGYIVEPRDAMAISEKILLLANDENQRLEMSRAARKKAVKFSWEKYKLNLGKFIKKIK